MNLPSIATALKRLARIWLKKPTTALADDAPATARWQSQLRVATQHPEGASVLTDMPTAMAGAGEHPSPGWFLRAGLASCLATSVVLSAASRAMTLQKLSVEVRSRSDNRGLLGLAAADGTVVSAAALRFDIEVVAAAQGVAPGDLKQLIEDSLRRSPVPCALNPAIPLHLHVQIES